MNDRQVEALADELEGCANNPARDSTEAVVECDVLRRAVKALRSRTPSAPDVAMREALKIAETYVQSAFAGFRALGWTANTFGARNDAIGSYRAMLSAHQADEDSEGKKNEAR